MKILLINQNATVEKLVRLSAAKVGLEVETVQDAGSVEGGDYAWVLIDHESLEENDPGALKARCQGAKLGLLHPKNGEKIPGFDLYIEKPFLPTELIDEFSAQMGSGDAQASAEEMTLPDLDEEGGALDGLDLGDDLGAPLEEMDDLPELSMDEQSDSSDVSGKEDEMAFGGDDLSLDELTSEPQELSLDELDDSASDNIENLEDLSLDFDNTEEEVPAPQAEENPLEELSIEADEVEEVDELENGQIETHDFDDVALEDMEAGEGGEETPKISILDKEEVEKVKELLSEDGPEDETADSLEELSLGDDELASFDEVDMGESEAQSSSDDVKIELGENSALLDEDDLADLHKGGHDLDDEALLDDSFGEMEEVEGDDSFESESTLEDSLAEGDMPEFDFSEHASMDDLGDEGGSGEEDLDSLSEASVAMALGESLPEEPSASEPAASALQEGTQSPAPSAASLEGALATLSPSTLRELLNGMQLTINISFPNKKS